MATESRGAPGKPRLDVEALNSDEAVLSLIFTANGRFVRLGDLIRGEPTKRKVAVVLAKIRRRDARAEKLRVGALAKLRAKKLSPERRREIAQKVAGIRWAKPRKKAGPWGVDQCSDAE